ncbi:MAG: permease [Bacteroidota bacterium]|nr:permease [Bacteroidota bacterium]
MFFKEMIILLPVLFILIGLFDVWIPKERIQKHLGVSSGIKGTLLVMFLAFLQAGPLYAAFPVAYLLWKKGCSPTNVFIYLSAFTTAKIPMITFEIGFLGLKFSLLRVLITIPVFIIIGIIMGRYFRKNNCRINKI